MSSGMNRTARFGCLLLLCALASACGSAGGPAGAPDAGDAGDPGCGILFGTPNAHTGLGPDQCRPECACGGDVYAPPAYDAAFIQALVDDWVPSAPYPPLVSDPYAGPAPVVDPEAMVCGVLPQGDAGASPRPYALVTYASEADAQAAGAHVTHFGHCGVCSTLANLAVYMANDDLTAPVRACGLEGDGDGDGGNPDVSCLMALGFDLPCAQAWAYDTANTRAVCLSVCLANLTAPYNLPDGGLNPCLACDETESGPIFKAVAGRTRRNSGIPNAICRPCSEVRPLVQMY
jgi:hypothetical protein